jgi:hypothetical protein
MITDEEFMKQYCKAYEQYCSGEITHDEMINIGAKLISDNIDYQIFIEVFSPRKNRKRRRLRKKWTMGKTKLIIGFHSDLDKNIMQHLLEEERSKNENLG